MVALTFVMTRIGKLSARAKSCPADLSWGELTRLLRGLGYEEHRGAGSRRKFRGKGLPDISLHEPHPGDIVKLYAVRQVVETLEREGLL